MKLFKKVLAGVMIAIVSAFAVCEPIDTERSLQLLGVISIVAAVSVAVFALKCWFGGDVFLNFLKRSDKSKDN